MATVGQAYCHLVQMFRLTLPPSKHGDSLWAWPGESPLKSKPQIVLRAPGCLCFKPKGMGGTRSAFPFWTFIFGYVCIQIHTHMCMRTCLSSQADWNSKISFSWGSLCIFKVSELWVWGSVVNLGWSTVKFTITSGFAFVSMLPLLLLVCGFVLYLTFKPKLMTLNPNDPY